MHSLNPFGGVDNLQQYAQFSLSYQGFQPLPNFGFPGGMFVVLVVVHLHMAQIQQPRNRK